MNRVLPEDRALCERTIKYPTSANERKFYKEILKKETDEISLSGDMIMSERDNDLALYILREVYDEYRIGVYDKNENYPELHVDGIAALTEVPLTDLGLPKEGTLGDWLRLIDYKGINYKANADKY